MQGVAEVPWFAKPREEETEGRLHSMGIFPPSPFLLFAEAVLRRPTS